MGAAVLMLSQGTAFAADDWPSGWEAGPSGTVAPGSVGQLHPWAYCSRLWPETEPCDYSSYHHLEVSALNDAEILNSVGSSIALVRSSTGEQVGTCTVNDSTHIRCGLSGSGSVDAGEQLSTRDAVVFKASTSACTPTLQIEWFNSSDPDEESTAVLMSYGVCGSR
ncbi:hypothetical protein [Streptomyces sp. NBRC 110611]|uniref:hypothetical protein n=1 Tax=Streptomyces sp. NBRC 110611 TaxID=1621259 RepID=UPI0008378705|nr:hypothetical protein [Streptomyces sp. NBRC 110611]